MQAKPVLIVRGEDILGFQVELSRQVSENGVHELIAAAGGGAEGSGAPFPWSRISFIVI
jgi:hypothetical protein